VRGLLAGAETSRARRSGPRLRSDERGLPPELAAAAASGLGALALTVTFAMLVVAGLGLFTRPGTGARPVRWDALGAIVAVSLALFAVCRWGKLPPARVLDLGAAYQVLVGLLIALHFHSLSPPTDLGLATGWSPLAVWMLLGPLVVPCSARRAVALTLATAAMDPLAHLLDQSPSMAACLRTVGIAAVLAPITSRIVYGLAMDVVRAREMGSYQLVERIGRGGMGEVWRAQHRLLARASVIKLIRPDLLGAASSGPAQEILRRFEREARATAALRSPHTIEVYDFGVTRDGTFYYVMEHLQGFSLETLVRRFGPLPPARVVSILRQACDSLAEAHHAGLIHRDIKPANVFLARRGLQVDFVKVLDFGLVTPPGPADPHLTGADVVIGTPAYMPPELALGRGDAVDGRADLYALGCVAYWLLTGRLVFEGGSGMQMMMDHIRTPPPPPSTRTAQAIPPALERLVLRCLEKEPDDRPAGAAALRDALVDLGLEAEWTAAAAATWWKAHEAEHEPPPADTASGLDERQRLETLTAAPRATPRGA
jgi:eukaryotic-like serine/threonine-protein kinase